MNTSRKISSWAITAGLAFCALLCVSLFPRLSAHGQRKPQPARFMRSQKAIPNRYIVTLNEDGLGLTDLPAIPENVTPEQKLVAIKQRGELLKQRVGDKANELASLHRGRVDHVYGGVFKGFSTEMSEADALALSQHPQVKYVEEDAEVTADQIISYPPIVNSCVFTGQEVNAPWGLDRIDQPTLPLSSVYSYGCDTGAGVNVYVIDSGIRTTHQEFGGRASNDADFVGDGQNGNDCNGHGTHVAATIGGQTYGVAKNARLHSIRVLDCSNKGRVSGAIAGMDSIAAGINQVESNHALPAVVNMSLGGPSSFAWDFATQALINQGVTVVVAAGNGTPTPAGWDLVGIDAGNISPANVTDAITVGATDSGDNRAVFSNYGPHIDLFAPGVSVLSAWNTSDTATNVISGTSMATPHVTGVAALYLQRNPRATPAAVQLALTMNATQNQVFNPGPGSPNLLLFNGVNVSGLYDVRAKNSGKVLDVAGISLFNGAVVQQWDYWGGDNQKWLISSVGNGYYKILAKHSGKSLDVTGISPYNGAVIEQWDYWGGDNQLWELTPVENGYYRITSKHSGKVLDVTGISPYAGAVIQQWDYWGGDNQKWRLEKLLQ